MPEPSPATGLLRTWIEPDPPDVPPDFQTAIGGHRLVTEILIRRGINSLPAARAFLTPDAFTPTPPEALPDIPEACQRIERAITQGETICVWGDFDVDGQTSTTLLVSALRSLGARVTYHIPVRAVESHGVNIQHLKPILDSGVSLVITCDTGISAHEAMEYARQRGVDVIITDHHELPEELPHALARVNPRRIPGDHALSGLPGVGVAYKLVEALYRRAGREKETTGMLDLVALGIVADLALQTADTRYLLQRGLPVLRSVQRTGLQVMFEMAGLQPAYLTEEHIGFIIGPRLNALGRLDDANAAVELLTTSDAGRARVLATHLEGLNARRRLLTGQVLRGAQSQIEKDSRILDDPVLVLANPEWPAGVIGIVASELAERYNRPTILLSAPPGQPARGSARSIEGVDITEAISGQKNLLLGFGGHPMAAGLSLDPSNLAAFRRGISHFVEKILAGAPPKRTLAIDGYISLNDLSLDLVDDLERLAPFGPGNPPLALAIKGLSILSSGTIGKDGNHLQITVKDEHDQTRRVLWWGGADWSLPESVFDLACTIRASNYRGQRDVQVEWIDARPVETGALHLRRTLAVVDQRGLDHPLPVLQSLFHDVEDGAVVWAEAEALERLLTAKIPCVDRNHLLPTGTLFLWTTPPGRGELQAALDAVHAHTVVVFSIDPAETTPEAYLKRLAGVVKFAMEKMGGEVEILRLAAATAQRETVVRLGLRWLEQRGIVQVDWLPEMKVRLKQGRAANPELASQTFEKIKSLLEEVSAYRQYFRSADKDFLL